MKSFCGWSLLRPGWPERSILAAFELNERAGHHRFNDRLPKLIPEKWKAGLTFNRLSLTLIWKVSFT